MKHHSFLRLLFPRKKIWKSLSGSFFRYKLLKWHIWYIYTCLMFLCVCVDVVEDWTRKREREWKGNVWAAWLQFMEKVSSFAIAYYTQSCELSDSIWFSIVLCGCECGCAFHHNEVIFVLPHQKVGELITSTIRTSNWFNIQVMFLFSGCFFNKLRTHTLTRKFLR